jgi:hypothetical protein
MALLETFIYANSVQDNARKPNAFWLDSLCQPYSKYIEEEDREEEVTDEDEKKLLTDQDVRCYYRILSHCLTSELIRFIP